MEFLVVIVVLLVLFGVFLFFLPLIVVTGSLFAPKKAREEAQEHWRNKRLVREAEVQRAKRELGEE